MIEALRRNSTELDNAEAAWFRESRKKTFEGLADSGFDSVVWIDRQLGAKVSGYFPLPLMQKHSARVIWGALLKVLTCLGQHRSG